MEESGVWLTVSSVASQPQVPWETEFVKQPRLSPILHGQHGKSERSRQRGDLFWHKIGYSNLIYWAELGTAVAPAIPKWKARTK